MRTALAVLIIILVAAGCSSKSSAPPPATTTPPQNAITGDGYVRFAASIKGPAIRITPDAPYCSIPVSGDDPLDLHTKITLTGHRPGGATGVEEFDAESVLGYGRIQPDGTCEFRVVMEFPTPATQPNGYTLSIRDRNGCQNYWPIPANEMMSGQRAQLSVSGKC